MPRARENPEPSRDELESNLRDARARTLALVDDLSDEQLMGPRLSIINPLLWEIGHVAWFQSRWVLGRLRNLPHARDDADRLYDSFAVAHDTRWDLPLPTRQETLRYMETELERACEALHAHPVDADTAYFYRLVTFHEDMHGEAFTYTRQTLEYPAPRSIQPRKPEPQPAAEHQDSIPETRFVEVPGGTFELGGSPDEAFVFDNEKWAHPVQLRPFRIATTQVTNGQFAEFVEDSGYARRELWSDAGWAWRQNVDAQHPVYWRRRGSEWEQRHFDCWHRLDRACAMIHVNWYEASAYCRWSRTRLPTEAEWEAAAACSGAALHKQRRHPWGNEPPEPQRANLDGLCGVVPANTLPAGDSGFGCRQMCGNVWEWTASEFQPFPGFVVDPYKEYSEPWFDGNHMVLRGGAWTTRARMLRNTFRNFYTRDRRDVLAGFRVCAE